MRGGLGGTKGEGSECSSGEHVEILRTVCAGNQGHGGNVFVELGLYARGSIRKTSSVSDLALVMQGCDVVPSWLSLGNIWDLLRIERRWFCSVRQQRDITSRLGSQGGRSRLASPLSQRTKLTRHK